MKHTIWSQLLAMACMLVFLTACSATPPVSEPASGGTMDTTAPTDGGTTGEQTSGAAGSDGAPSESTASNKTNKPGQSGSSATKTQPTKTVSNGGATATARPADFATAQIGDMLAGRMFNGLGEPLYFRAYDRKDADVDKTVDLMAEMGAKTVRLWTEFGQVFNGYNPKSPNMTAVNRYKDMVAKFNKRGIAVIGMCHSFAFNNQNWNSLPAYDRAAGSDYMQFLDYWESSWYELARLLPEIKFWQVGNETNADVYLHPVGYPTKTFTDQQRVEITLDLLYRGKKAVNRAGTGAKVIMMGLSPYAGMNSGNVEDFLDTMYYGIETGKYGSKNPRDFFDVLAWHPYNLIGGEFKAPDKDWVDYNNAIFQVAKNHGDGNVPVFFTEFGYTDFGDAAKDKAQREYFQTAYKMAREKMPYVKVFVFFRMYNDPSAEAWGGAGEVNFGMFKSENGKITPKQKAFGYKQAAGSQGNIEKYAK